MEHLDTTSRSSQEHQEETLCLGVKLQVRQQKKRKNGAKRPTERRKKGLVLPSLKHYVLGAL